MSTIPCRLLATSGKSILIKGRVVKAFGTKRRSPAFFGFLGVTMAICAEKI